MALTLPPLGRTLAPTMPTGFDEAFRRVKELLADFTQVAKQLFIKLHR